MNASFLDSRFEANRTRFVEDWIQFLRFPSVSADPARAGDCRQCAQWLTDHLRRMGFKAELLETPSNPAVFAEIEGEPGTPAVLLYGHYDVQPPDPLDRWDGPPFDPQFRGERLYARGAQDNKGQLMAVLKAIETLLAAGRPPCTIRILVEGDEERGSTGLSSVLAAQAERLRSDVLMVCDSGAVAPDTPTIIVGLRGLVHLTVTLTGPRHDLHSGTHGGLAPNPATAMARLMATLHHPDGRVAADGFYDSVSELESEERRLANAVPFDPARYRRETGVDPVGGEPQFTPAERAGFRPTLEVNGIHSGYGGPGSKTIIPADATAKLSARLVAGQDPEAVLDAIVRHLTRHAPKGLTMTIPEEGTGGPALRLNARSPLVTTARDILREITGREAVVHWEGASIPILTELSRVSGAAPLLVGAGSEEDNIHAPNESFSISQFRQDFLFAGLFLSRLAAPPPGAPFTFSPVPSS